jgi:GNAT superfamily N-acetyltransferase
MVIVRRATFADDLVAAGRVVQDAYRALPGYPADDEYDAMLADVAGRMHDGDVVIAVDGDTVVGCLTFVPGPGGGHFEFDDHEATSFRYFGVAAGSQRSGIGEAMVRWCIDETRRLGKPKLRIHTIGVMVGAIRLYERMGFVRTPEADFDYDGIIGLAYLYDLRQAV